MRRPERGIIIRTQSSSRRRRGAPSGSASIARALATFVCAAIASACATTSVELRQTLFDRPALGARSETHTSAPKEVELDDGLEDDDPVGVATAKRGAHPLDGLTPAALKARYLRDPHSVGSISLGRIHGGVLINAVRMPEGKAWIVRQPALAWGTQETVDSLTHCINAVRDRFPGTSKLYVGHLSRESGGALAPHVSHQNGRDVDVGYYYTGDEPWYTRATAENLDRARTWAFVRCMIVDTDVELIIIDRSIQQLLKQHALDIGEDPHWLDRIFGGKTASVSPLIRHARGHATHIHVRFFSPVARETGRRMFDILAELKVIELPSEYVLHEIHKGDTLLSLARRYHTSPAEIRKANGLRGNLLRLGRSYKVPHKVGIEDIEREPIAAPQRRLPPASPANAAHDGDKAAE